jgi:hypothetical protein
MYKFQELVSFYCIYELLTLGNGKPLLQEEEDCPKNCYCPGVIATLACGELVGRLPEFKEVVRIRTRYLDIMNSALTTLDIKPSHWPNLHILDLRGNPLTSCWAIQDVKERLENVIDTILTDSHCFNVTLEPMLPDIPDFALPPHGSGVPGYVPAFSAMLVIMCIGGFTAALLRKCRSSGRRPYQRPTPEIHDPEHFILNEPQKVTFCKTNV